MEENAIVNKLMKSLCATIGLTIMALVMTACGGSKGDTVTEKELTEAMATVMAMTGDAAKTQVVNQTPTTAALTSAGSMPQLSTDVSHGAWKIQGTTRLPENPVVAGWLSRLQDPKPELWKSFPNIRNMNVPEFERKNCRNITNEAGAADIKCEVPDGMEYGTYSTPYCFAHPCDIPVGPWEYRYISGDYSFLGTECRGDMSKGCMLVLINVMDQAYTWRGQDVDNGFTLRGRYFNGDKLEWGVWGLISHGAANMLNMPTEAHPGEVLNSGDPGNSGGNCGTPIGCKSVSVTLVVHAGDAIIAIAKTTVTKSR